MKSVLIFLIAFTILGGFLRLADITKNPVSLNIDEVAIGYNAYSILKTGRDEYGQFLPLSFKSTGDYKNPVPVYSMVPSIAVFGLNEFGVRLPTALFAILTIPLSFFLFFEITKKKKTSLIGSFLLSISPWHIYYSRYLSDTLIGTFFVMLGMLAFLRMLSTGKRYWVVISSLALVLSMYSYHPERIFVPLFVGTLLILKKGIVKLQKTNIVIFTILCAVLVLPIVYSMVLGPGAARAQMTWMGNDIEFTRNVLVKPLLEIPVLGSKSLLLFGFWARKYLNYFDPAFLFYNGLSMTMSGSYGLGIMYLFEIPWLILGIITLIRKKLSNNSLIAAWILIGIFPASLTNNEQHSGRTLFILPMMILISAIGLTEFIKLIKVFFKPYLSNIIFVIFLIFIAWNLTLALIIYSVHFPKEQGEAFMEGTKETVEYALANENNYREIVLDPYRGIEAPYIVSIPHMYILFYSKYDPHTYQNEVKMRPDGSFGFSKFTIRRIDWRVDRYKKDTLFIGSPWSLPKQDIKSEEILKKVYLSSGDLAFLIVAAK